MNRILVLLWWIEFHLAQTEALTIMESHQVSMFDHECWVAKSTSSAMSSSLTLRRISPTEWHEQSPGNTSCTGMCQLETSTDQRYVLTRCSSPKERGHDLTKSWQFRHVPNRWGKRDVPRLPTIQWLETYKGPSLPENGGHEEYSENVGWLPIKSQETDETIEREGKTLPNWNHNSF